MAEPQMPDLSHLSAEEKKIIEEVFQRQRAEEEKEIQLSQISSNKKADRELEEIEKQINERKQNAQRLLGTQDDAICQICQKTKFADGVGHKCFYCQLRSCARCGGRTTSKNKPIWACSLCQKRQKIIAKTGKWFKQGAAPDATKDNFGHSDISYLIILINEVSIFSQNSNIFSPSTSTSTTPQPSAEPRSSSVHIPSHMSNTSSNNASAANSGRASANSMQNRSEMTTSEAVASRITDYELPSTHHQQNPSLQKALSAENQPNIPPSSSSSSSTQRHSQNSQNRKQGVLHRQSTLENEGKQDNAVSARKHVNGSRRVSVSKMDSQNTSKAPDRTRREAKKSLVQEQRKDTSQSPRYSPFDERKHSDDLRHRPDSASTSQYDDTRAYNESGYTAKDTNASNSSTNRYRRDEVADQNCDNQMDRYDNSSKRLTNRSSSYRSPKGSFDDYSRQTFTRNESDAASLSQIHHSFKAVPATSGGETSFSTINKTKKSRLFRQCRSMSSSEEDSPSTSGWFYKESSNRRPDTDLNSEKDILHYIYESEDNETSRKIISMGNMIKVSVLNPELKLT
uniref:RabBD domain-containing protein n=1 Tax=Syphacia muris TaxID=451379 RepID=A0A0N5AZ55_9BILA